MYLINLLPHREMKRQALNRQLAMFALLVALVGGLVWLMGHTLLAGAIGEQLSRNAYIEKETKVLDEQIKEIEDLKQTIDLMAARKQVVEDLQTNRSKETRVLDFFARNLPPGLYLSGLEEKGDTLIVRGYAESSARVSSFMRNITDARQDGDTPLFQPPRLVEIKATNVNDQRLQEFELRTALVKPKPAKETNKSKASR